MSGQVKVSNRGLKRILERTVGENRASWSDKLDDALWAFRTAYKTLIRCTPYKLIYGKSCHLPAYESSVIYKERTKKLHDSKIKNRIFNVGDQVLLFNSRLKIFSEKLKTRWSGPFTITQVFPYGTIELLQPNGPNFKVNGHRVKHYFGGKDYAKTVTKQSNLGKIEHELFHPPPYRTAPFPIHHTHTSHAPHPQSHVAIWTKLIGHSVKGRIIIQAHHIGKFTLIQLVKETQGVDMDCHPGNPCDISLFSSDGLDQIGKKVLEAQAGYK
nr:reverse transcriptase domain-containing protein [Tanacetum cinerariifolium]